MVEQSSLRTSPQRTWRREGEIFY